jgi:hypothetical protein
MGCKVLGEVVVQIQLGQMAHQQNQETEEQEHSRLSVA